MPHVEAWRQRVALEVGGEGDDALTAEEVQEGRLPHDPLLQLLDQLATLLRVQLDSLGLKQTIRLGIIEAGVIRRRVRNAFQQSLCGVVAGRRVEVIGNVETAILKRLEVGRIVHRNHLDISADLPPLVDGEDADDLVGVLDVTVNKPYLYPRSTSLLEKLAGFSTTRLDVRTVAGQFRQLIGLDRILMARPQDRADVTGAGKLGDILLTGFPINGEIERLSDAGIVEGRLAGI